MSILQVWLRISTRDYKEQIQFPVRMGHELGASELQGQCSNRLVRLRDRSKRNQLNFKKRNNNNKKEKITKVKTNT